MSVLYCTLNDGEAKVFLLFNGGEQQQQQQQQQQENR
jgi:hypothetical protein